MIEVWRTIACQKGACRGKAALRLLILFLSWIPTTILPSDYAAAYPRQMPNYLHHQVWSTEDGLPQASVHAILQSRQGYLWVGTEDGAASFDGQSFHVLSHATVPEFESNDVSCLAEDDAGDMWFGTSDGLVRKHGDEYRRFSEQDGLPAAEIVALSVNPAGLLVLTSGGLAVWNGGRFKRVSTTEVITGLASTKQDSILISQKRVYRWNRGQLTVIESVEQDQSPILGAPVSDMHATWAYGSNFVEFSSPSLKRIWRTGSDLPGNRVQSLYVDPEGRAWIGTDRGLVSVEPIPGSIVRESQALSGESVLSIYCDREGDLWVGTESSGLYGFQPRKFAIVPGSSSEAVTTIVRDNRGLMYFGTRDDGIFRSKSVEKLVSPKELTSPVILSLAVGPDGDLWAGTPDGLNHITGNGVRHWTIADGLPDNFVRSVVVAPDGTVWCGTRFGLVHIDSRGVQTFTTADGLPSDSIGPLLQLGSKQKGTNTLWIGTSMGLCNQAAYKFHCLSSPYVTKDSIITALAVDQDKTLWLGLHGHGLGVVEVDRIVSVPTPTIPSEIVGILADHYGYLWLRSARRLFRAQVSELRTCIAKASACGSVTLDAYGRSDGMQSDEVAGEGSPPLVEGPDGELWVATRRGIAITDPQHMIPNHVPPGVAITQVQVDGVSIPTGTDDNVGSGHRQYNFQYAGISLNDPIATRCRFRLDGFDRGWVDAGTRRIAYYTNLTPRQYAFNVLCANRDGLWSTSEATFRFRVLRPWYRSVWVYLLGLCLVSFVIFGFVQLKVRSERNRFDIVLRERTRVAREVHDTLAQDLVSVSLQVEMAAQLARAGNLEAVTDQLGRTRSLVRESLESARQSIWNLRTNLSKETLPARLSARLDGFRGTNVSARLRISGEYRSAAAAIEDEVVRIASEAISNAERHSGATEIAVTLTYGPDSLNLEVRDNGSGFDCESGRQKIGHYGLRGLEERAALLQARLLVESVAGKGTTVRLLAPLSREKV